MPHRSSIGALALAAMLAGSGAPPALGEGKYPDWESQWRNPTAGRGGNPWDPSKPMGLGQQAPLTPEYQALFDASLKEQAAGGQGLAQTNSCISPGMPRVTNGYGQMEVVVTPRTTYITIEHINDNRRIYTDGRGWPAEIEPTFLGYSIGT